MLGLGGKYVEVFRDVRFGVPPLSTSEAHDVVGLTIAAIVALGGRALVLAASRRGVCCCTALGVWPMRLKMPRARWVS